MLVKKPFDTRFTHLFTPGYIGNLWVKNRIVRTSMLTNWALASGEVTPNTINHYKELARGGSGMVNVEYSYIDNDAAKANDGQIGISTVAHQNGLRWLANAIKAEGARATMQIAHAGRQRFSATQPFKTAFRRPWPDIYKYGGVGQQGKGGVIPNEMTVEEIQQVIEDFGSAAVRAQEVGFDGCELHAGHGYLLTNFLSPWNRRNDWYGGHFVNRKRIVMQTFERMRQRVGPGFTLGVRLSWTDYDPINPIPLEETIEVAKELESLGCDYIHVSGGIHEFGHKETVVMYYPMALQAEASAKIRKAVGIPVICSGSLGDPELAEKILKEGKGDFVGLGRPLLADPYFPKKAQEGCPEEIRPCIRCMECNDKGCMIGYTTCAVNPVVGREGEFSTIPVAAKKKKVAVVGGGPSGMEAARVAALKGHDVTLYEKKELGGLLLDASIPDSKADLRRLVKYYVTQMEKRGIKVVKEEATAAKIKKGNFNTVIVATGSQPITPKVPGVNKSIVAAGLDVLRGAPTGKNVIVIGGGLVGSEIAAFLAEQGKNVTVIEATDQLATGLSGVMKNAFFEIISKLPIQMKINHMLTEITEKGIIATCGLKQVEIKGDTVVIATGFSPEHKLWDDLCKVADMEVYAIGDCVKVQTSYEAIHDGFNTAFSLV